MERLRASEKKQETDDQTTMTLSLVIYSIGCLGVAFIAMLFNFALNIPIFNGFRASPVFLIFTFFLVTWIKVLLVASKNTLVPLLLSDIIWLFIDYGLNYIYRQNPLIFGPTSNYLYYFSQLFILFSLILLSIFIIKIKMFLRRDGLERRG